MKFFWLLLLCACGLTDPKHVDTTFTLPLGEISQVTAPGETNTLDVDAVGAGGENNLFIRGSSGAWIALRGVPFERKDTLFAYVAKAVGPTAEVWEQADPTWLYVSTAGGFVLTAGTNYGEGGRVKRDSSLSPFVKLYGAGFAGTAHGAGAGFWNNGWGGSATRSAGNGMIRVRFYVR